jgi:hypothetical protein
VFDEAGSLCGGASVVQPGTGGCPGGSLISVAGSVVFISAQQPVWPVFASLAEISAMPHLGQLSGLALTTSACMGQVYCSLATLFALAF